MPEQNQLKNLENQILSSGGEITCPNPTCKGLINSEIKPGTAGKSNLNYWCTDETCENSKRRVATLSLGNTLKRQIQENIAKIGSKAITGIATMMLVIGAAIGNFIPDWLGISTSPEQSNTEYKAMEVERDSLKDLLRKVENLDLDAGKVLAYEKVIDSLDTKLQAFTNQPINDCRIEDLINKGKRELREGKIVEAKTTFAVLMDNDYREALSNSLDSRNKVVELIGNSYTSNAKITTKYLANEKDFQFLENFLKTFHNQWSYYLLGKAYERIPSYREFPSKKVRKLSEEIFDLSALKNYLIAVKENEMPKKHIQRIRKLTKDFQLFEFNVQSGPDYTPIDSLISQQNTRAIQSRIEEVDFYIKDRNTKLNG